MTTVWFCTELWVSAGLAILKGHRWVGITWLRCCNSWDAYLSTLWAAINSLTSHLLTHEVAQSNLPTHTPLLFMKKKHVRDRRHLPIGSLRSAVGSTMPHRCNINALWVWPTTIKKTHLFSITGKYENPIWSDGKSFADEHQQQKRTVG